MIEWMFAHPWLTFWLGFFALVVIDGAITNICRVIIYIYNLKYEKNNLEETLDKE